MASYYDGTKLLSLSDINGRKPEIYICTSNRSAGKTTYFNRLCVNKFKKTGEKFCLLYRYNYELDDCADKFFKDINTLFFPDSFMVSKPRAEGKYHELFLDDVPCGYAIAMNDADFVKRNSHLFSDVQRMVLDEFQSESGRYCDKEITKFISVHTSIARGQKKQVRYVPVILIGNPITLLNPYYSALGISSRLRSDTVFLRGNGFVLEQGFNESAAKAQELSAFNAAFEQESYTAYARQGVYLNDNTAFIEKPQGTSRYIATIRYNNNDYAIREYASLGILYCDDRPDASFKNKLCVTTDDFKINYVMLKSHALFVTNMRYFFDKGSFRFKNLKCKDAIMQAVSYR